MTKHKSLLEAAANGTKEEFEEMFKQWLTRGWRRIWRGEDGGPRD